MIILDNKPVDCKKLELKNGDFLVLTIPVSATTEIIGQLSSKLINYLTAEGYKDIKIVCVYENFSLKSHPDKTCPICKQEIKK